MGTAVLRRGEQATLLPHRAANEIHRALRRSQPFTASEDARGMGHALDHQCVPAAQDLVVATGTNAGFPGGKQLLAGRLKHGHVVGADCRRDAGMPVATLEVWRAVEAPAPCRQRRLLRAQQAFSFAAIPYVVLAFFTFRVGIERGTVAALGRLHFAHYPGCGFFGHAGV